eukprot:m.8995 g.8995  ORF g.8995 m.8995 type:complete len:531 (+) comp21015_c0_seq1:75-1667(+)
MNWFSFTNVVLALFSIYLCHSIYTFYAMFFPDDCLPQNDRCLPPFATEKDLLELHLYTSKKNKENPSDLKLVFKKEGFLTSAVFSQSVNVTLPKSTRQNGTLYAHIFTAKEGRVAAKVRSEYTSYVIVPLTQYAVKEAEVISLLSGSDDSTPNKSADEIVSHWRPKLVTHVMNPSIAFSATKGYPGELVGHVRFTSNGKYLPILYVDQLGVMLRQLQPINENSTEMALEIQYSPISVGKLRMWLAMQKSLELFKTLGFSEKDVDEVKGIFVDTNLYLLSLTFFVSAFHLLFDFLAFKNDITYWKERESMAGLSSRTVAWRCFSQFVIFLYLMDEDTSLIVIIPAGIATVIEFWKVTKAYKLSLEWKGFIPNLKLGSVTDVEKETEKWDSEAMKYLSYILYPLLIVGAIYSLVYVKYKSWYSFLIHSLVNGVYAFGFIFMLPQLFLNYKLKSVAHLPWRVFMYKAFNTFIDDVFAFIITMPTAHRVAVFRDDLVFVIFLYQRYLYPVDKSRANEFGVSYEDKAEQIKQKKD